MLIYYNAVIRLFLRKERAGQESVLEIFYRDGRAGTGPGREPGDSSADFRDDYRYIVVNSPDLNATGAAIVTYTIPSGDKQAIR